MSDTLDTNTIGIIQNSVVAKVLTGELFTAFDISRNVQAFGVKLRHNTMKHVVHEMFEDARDDEDSDFTDLFRDYTRTLVSVVANQPPAYVYHNKASDPFTYVSTQNPNTAVASATAAQAPITPAINPITNKPVAATVAAKVAVSTDAVVKEVDAKNRLRFPVSVLRAIGAKPSSTVYATLSTNSDTVIIETTRTTTSIPGVEVKPYVLDYCGNIRVALGDISTKKFNIEVQNNRVIASPA